MKCNKNFVVEKEYCVWTYALCDCGEQENIFRNIIMGGALLNGLCVVLSVLSLILLKRKINYIRVWSLIFCTTRLICCSVILFDLFNDETLLRELIFIISWWPGIVAIFVYLSIVIRVIPRLNLNQNTNNKYKTILIPAGGWDEQQINTTYIYSSEYGSSQRYHNNNNSQQTLSSFQSITRASSQLEPNWTNNNQEIQSNRQNVTGDEICIKINIKGFSSKNKEGLLYFESRLMEKLEF
ncbi:hypothetical protein RhiirA4_418150 [Rhizophagus irregularis]|uniref:Uncharacterized protein n=1 Tax=Rhizophagus irregularis TaxID=588596 RepID=A0A2I1G9H7_9GLOM|nr:hypothetical protein RhiirA4_418150 [Rhizophagus irregularis]